MSRAIEKIAVAFLLSSILVACASGGSRDGGRDAMQALASAPWVADLGNGAFKNPVLFADYSDPDVIRVGDDFYLTASSFTCVPGLPILHSKDLVNWEIVGHAAQRLSARYDGAARPGEGIWAPSLRYHDGWFWIFVGDPDIGVLMTKAQNPAGPWTPLHVVKAGKGLIDTCPLWDDDGQAYLVHAWAKSRAGISDILTVNRMSPDGERLLDEGKMVFDGRNGVAPTLEGPKFYKRDGWYCILAPAGGVTRGYQLAFRAKSPFGPYEMKRVLEQGTTSINGPHQGGWVHLESGEDWFLHFQDRGPYGRVVHLNPVHWVDGWPLMGVDRDGNGVGEPVRAFKKPNVGKAWPIAIPATSDAFDGSRLGLQWQWMANPAPKWASLDARPGWLRLIAVAPPAAGKNLWTAGNVLSQKFPGPAFTATAKLEYRPQAPGERAGLVVAGMSYSALVLVQTEAGLELRRVTCKNADKGKPERVEATAQGLPTGTLWLRVTVAEDANETASAICVFSYSVDGVGFRPLGEPFAAAAGRWIGAKVGLFCMAAPNADSGGHLDCDWFHVEKSRD
jgi:beta-xylosidase